MPSALTHKQPRITPQAMIPHASSMPSALTHKQPRITPQAMIPHASSMPSALTRKQPRITPPSDDPACQQRNKFVLMQHAACDDPQAAEDHPPSDDPACQQHAACDDPQAAEDHPPSDDPACQQHAACDDPQAAQDHPPSDDPACREVARKEAGTQWEACHYDHSYASTRIPCMKRSTAAQMSPDDILFYTGVTSEVFRCLAKATTYLLPGDEIMADRGFTLDTHLEIQGIGLNMPAFTRGKQQLTEEVTKARRIASVRIHVERAINRIKTYRIFKQPLSIKSRKHFDYMVFVCAGLCNLKPQLIREEQNQQ
ncbi:uncharacterized protein ISCGN_032399 [Ixodes scapularis]